MNSCKQENLPNSASSKTRNLREFLLVAQITAPHGIGGELKYRLLGNNPDSLADTQGIYLLNQQEQVISRANFELKGSAKTGILKIADINTREAAETLKWFYLARKRSESKPLPDGRYYVCDLLGCQVIEGENVIGRLKDILQYTAQDVYVVQRKDKKDLLFPLTPDTLVEVDLQIGYIKVKLPAGLLEIYE